jgi:YD repeat-containing protein
MKCNHARSIIFTILFVTTLGTGCKPKAAGPNVHAGIEFYRSLQFSETPFDIERGKHKITADEAKNINSYKFTYDESGRLVSVEYVRGDVLLGYSSMGRAAKVVYTYTDDKQIKHFFDKDNKPVESQGVFAYEYALDETGMRRGLMFLDKDGNMIENGNKIHSFRWSKLPDGMIRENRYNLEGKEVIMNEFCPFYELRFSYNDKGYVTRMANYQGDSLYNCTAENCGDIGVSYFSFVPNENGDLESFSVHNVVGQLSNLYWGWAKRLNKVDENGNVLEIAVFDQDEEYLGGKNVPVTQFEYDEHGAVVKVKNLDKDRMLINDPDNGVAVIEYKYDALGHPTDTLRFDKDSKPLASR